jgi:hypothetical protein
MIRSGRRARVGSRQQGRGRDEKGRVPKKEEMMADMPDANNIETQNWTDVVLSTQKRARSAFFLSLLVSCVVLITVFNLGLSHERGVPPLNGSAPQNVQEESKEHIKHQVDRSYYVLPLLGIQITCDDAAFFGPLALLVFSFYALIALRALDHQVKCLNRPDCRSTRGVLIMRLLEPELLPWVALDNDTRRYFLCTPSRLMSLLLFLPSVAGTFTMAYEVYHFFVPPYFSAQPLYQLMTTAEVVITAILDVMGLLFTILVFVYNFRTYHFSKTQFDWSSEAGNAAVTSVAVGSDATLQGV